MDISTLRYCQERFPPSSSSSVCVCICVAAITCFTAIADYILFIDYYITRGGGLAQKSQLTVITVQRLDPLVLPICVYERIRGSSWRGTSISNVYCSIYIYLYPSSIYWVAGSLLYWSFSLFLVYILMVYSSRRDTIENRTLCSLDLYVYIIALLRNGYNFFTFFRYCRITCVPPLNGVYNLSTLFFFSCSQMIFNGFFFFRIKRKCHQSRCLVPFTIGNCWNISMPIRLLLFMRNNKFHGSIRSVYSTQPLNWNKSRHFSITQKSWRDLSEKYLSL